MTVALLAPLAAADGKDVLTEEFRKVVMYAHTVAIVEVTGSTIEQERMEWFPPSWAEKVAFKNPVLLYGKAVPKGPAVVHANPYRGQATPAASLKPGAKVIVAWQKRGAALVPHSKAAVLATRRALAPGWFVDPGLMCPACMKLTYTADIGKCEACAGGTASGMYKLCANCGPLTGQCQACKRTVGPATPDVSLKLGYIPPFSKRMEPAELKIPAGGTPKLWVCVRGDARRIPPVAELPCMSNNLATCQNLFFLVEGPGIRGVEVVRPSILMVRATVPHKPLTKANAFAEFELVVLPDGKAFKAQGSYTVRAAAGRLVSNPRKVVVAPGPIDKGVTVPVPLPPGRVHELEGLQRR